MLADRGVPNVAAPQLALIEPDLDTGRAQRSNRWHGYRNLLESHCFALVSLAVATRGRLTKTSIAWMIPTILLSSGRLLAWVFLRGWAGVLMAAAYGLVLGIIREDSAGLLAPVATHIFADATIFVIIYFISTGILETT